MAHCVMPVPAGAETDQVTPVSVGVTPADPVTVAVKVIVEGITPVSVSVRTTVGEICVMTTLVEGVGANNDL